MRAERKTMAGAALDYAAEAWPIFPVRPRGKDPLVSGGFKAASVVAAQVRRWWTRWQAANIGFVPGRAGLLVIDVDGPEGREEAIRLGLFAEPTLSVETARGEHLYFTHPGGTIGNRKLGPGLDVRADAGYVLLPPSVHPTGALYTWTCRAPAIALPPTVLDALRDEPPPDPAAVAEPPVDAGTPRRRAYVAAAIEAECLTLARTPEGDRNNALNRAAFALARFMATGEADPEKLVSVLTYAARNTGLPDREIRRTIRSAFDARGVQV